MPKVILASAISRWLTAVPKDGRGEVAFDVSATTVREALDAVFMQHPNLRGYVVDEHGTLRHHVVAWLDNLPVTDKATLQTPMNPDSELYLFQALSGGGP